MVTVEKLRAMRERKGFTQAELAKAAGLSETTVVRIEQGKDAYPSTLRKLAKALAVAPESLVADA
jgi:transcriptional regulator with XRE-family HTH domain